MDLDNFKYEITGRRFTRRLFRYDDLSHQACGSNVLLLAPREVWVSDKFRRHSLALQSSSTRKDFSKQTGENILGFSVQHDCEPVSQDSAVKVAQMGLVSLERLLKVFAHEGGRRLGVHQHHSKPFFLAVVDQGFEMRGDMPCKRSKISSVVNPAASGAGSRYFLMSRR